MVHNGTEEGRRRWVFVLKFGPGSFKEGLRVKLQ